MNISELLLGQIPEAIYFSLFMVFTKSLKGHRVKFTLLMTLSYVLLLNIFPFSTWSHLLCFVATYIIMKLLYKQKCQITDVFTLGIASMILMITSIIPYFIIWFTVNNYLLYVIINRVLLFGILFICKNKLPKIQDLYKLFWNRNDKIHKRMKSTTFRAASIVTFNISFAIISICMLFAMYLKEVL